MGTSYRSFSNEDDTPTFELPSFPLIHTKRAILFKLGQLTLNQDQAGIMSFTASFLYDQEDSAIIAELDKNFSKNG
jgi:hypothetical protein